MSELMSYLFKTNAIKFCEENKPFWYTSGKIGPYFINTHFLYGNEEDATKFLEFCNQCLENKETLPKKVFNEVLNQYNTNAIYKNVINTIKKYIEENIDISKIDYISGGERRDWYFSNIIANLMKKPHITIYKNLSVKVNDSNFENEINIKELKGKNVLHIADLITVASSYIRAWIPVITNLGAKMCWSCAVVDRMQGGKNNLEAQGVKSFSPVKIDKGLFEKALNMNIINKKQCEMLNKFYDNPDETMKNFLIEHQEFIKNSLNADEKTRKRAELLIESDLYNIKK